MYLTDAAIRKFKLGDNAPKAGKKLTDGHGLYLHVVPTGSKLWRYQYLFSGKPKLISLGQYPAVSLALARERHAEARRQLAAGVDPSQARKRAGGSVAPQERTFETIFRAWFEHWKHDKEGRHVDQTRRRVEADILPAFGAKAADEVTPADVRELMLKIWNERGARDIAKRTHETVSQVYRYAFANGLAKQNPASVFKPNDVLPNVASENFARVEAKQLPALLAKMEVYEGAQVTRHALWLLAYTFVRTSELIEAPWSEFDLDNARWEIPAERMKMKTPHIVPLCPHAVEVLRQLQKVTGKNALLFPGDRDKKKPMSNNTILKALERMGYKGVMTGHGWRGIASTVLHEAGYDEAQIELQLAHMPRNKVAAAYNHAKYLPQRTEMMVWWGNYLQEQKSKAS